MNFLEHREKIKFKKENINEEIISYIIENIKGIDCLNNISFNILVALKYLNKNLFNKIVESERELIEVAKYGNSKKIKSKIEKYKKYLTYLSTYYKMNKNEVDKMINKIIENEKINMEVK